jgi:hypothetical protein
MSYYYGGPAPGPGYAAPTNQAPGGSQQPWPQDQQQLYYQQAGGGAPQPQPPAPAGWQQPQPYPVAGAAPGALHLSMAGMSGRLAAPPSAPTPAFNAGPMAAPAAYAPAAPQAQQYGMAQPAGQQAHLQPAYPHQQHPYMQQPGHFAAGAGPVVGATAASVHAPARVPMPQLGTAVPPCPSLPTPTPLRRHCSTRQARRQLP